MIKPSGTVRFWLYFFPVFHSSLLWFVSVEVMICHECKKNKLAKEFPYEHLTEECIKHPLLHCLRVRINRSVIFAVLIFPLYLQVLQAI